VDEVKKNEPASVIRFFDRLGDMNTYEELGNSPNALAYLLECLHGKDSRSHDRMVQAFWNVSASMLRTQEQFKGMRNWLLQHATELIKHFLSVIPKDPNAKKSRTERCAVNVLLNFSEDDDMRPHLNAAGVVDKCLSHAKSDLTAAIMCANLLGSLPDSVNDKLMGSDSSMIDRLIHVFDMALAGKADYIENEGAIWWPEEVCLCVINLCQNDKNKVALVHHGILPRLVKTIKNDGVPAMQVKQQRERAAKAVWQLAFVEANKQHILDSGAVEALQALRDDTDPDSADSGTYKQAVGALWQLGLKRKEESKDDDAMTALGSGDEWKHIMISYNWAAQKPIIALKKQLEAKGYRVWLDIESMQGSTLEAMARAVECSHVFCMAMSRKYKESANCRAEAEYAFNLRKPIIPILVEQNYRPDGWLGALLGTKLYYDLSPAMRSNPAGDIEVNDDALAKISPGIVKDLVSQLPRGVGAGAPASPSVATTTSSGGGNSSSASSGWGGALPHLTWEVKDVCAWLEKSKLGALVSSFQEQFIDGIALEELRRMANSDQTAFLKACESYLRFQQLGLILRFSYNLRLLA